MVFPIEYSVMVGEVVFLSILIMIFVWVAIYALMYKARKRKIGRRIENEGMGRPYLAITLLASVLISMVISYTFQDKLVHKVDVGQENSPFRILEQERDKRGYLQIHQGKLEYNTEQSVFFSDIVKELGDIKVDENNIATLTPTTPLGVTFVRYGRYVLDNPELESGKVFHDIDFNGDYEIQLTIYDDDFGTSEVVIFGHDHP